MLCSRCNRVLKRQPWVSIGMGKVCKAKFDAERQMSINFSNDTIIPYDGGDIFIKRENGKIVTNIQRIMVRHSPSGFEFGYAGSGPADAALNVMLMFCKEKANKLYQDFKFRFLNKPGDCIIIKKEEIQKFISEHE